MYNNSPLMNTPYLDASTSNDTPFIDAISPPFYDTVTDFSQYLKKGDDICIANYLSDMVKLTQDPVTFNGDPSLLLIDKSKTPLAPQKASPVIKLESVDEKSSVDNTLFPPLQQQSQYAPFDTSYEEGMSLDEILGFDASSPLTEVMDEPEQEVKAEEQKEEKQEEQKATKKRKSTKANTATIKKPRTTKKEVKLYQCPLCDHQSKRRYNLSTHIKTHDKFRVKEFDCTLCPKSFDRRHDRDRHLATVHRKERTHGCPHCINQFSRKDALNRHLVQKHDYDEADLED